MCTTMGYNPSGIRQAQIVSEVSRGGGREGEGGGGREGGGERGREGGERGRDGRRKD